MNIRQFIENLWDEMQDKQIPLILCDRCSHPLGEHCGCAQHCLHEHSCNCKGYLSPHRPKA